MTPEQLHAVAARLRERYSSPWPTMSPGQHASAVAIEALAWALEEQARAEEQA